MGDAQALGGDEDRAYYLDRLAAVNELDTDVKVDVDDKIVMMSTCTAQLDDNRYCVFGKLVKAKEKKAEKDTNQPIESPRCEGYNNIVI